MIQNEQIDMVGECTDSYRVERLDDGRTKISILIPIGFRWLWMSKLCDLQTTLKEIEECRNYDREELSLSAAFPHGGK
jgi:hypothetical protein